MDFMDGVDGWTLPDTLQLLVFHKADVQWSDVASRLKAAFGHKKDKNFFNEKACKEKFERIVSSPHPEHFLRLDGKKYSHKDLVQAWISFLESKMKEEKSRKSQLLLVKFREKMALFNKLFDDNSSLPEERLSELLEEARLEDSKRDQRAVERNIALLVPKLKELSSLHKEKPKEFGCLRLVVPVPQLCEPELAEQSASGEALDVATTSSRSSMNLRSASQSPQKSSLIQSPQKTPTLHSPERIQSVSPQKQQKGVRSLSQKQTTSPQRLSVSPPIERSPVKTPVLSPERRRSSLSSPSREPTGILSLVSGSPNKHYFDESQKEGSLKSRAAEIGTQNEDSTVPMNGSAALELKDNESELKPVVKQEIGVMEVDQTVAEPAGRDTLDIVTGRQVRLASQEAISEETTSGLLEFTGTSMETVTSPRLSESGLAKASSSAEHPAGEKTPGKRQLRSSRKESTSADTPTPVTTRGTAQRPQRSSSRKLSVTSNDISAESLETPQLSSEQVHRRRTSVTSVTSVDSPPQLSVKSEESRAASLRGRVRDEKGLEETEEVHSRRRSDRLRGTDTVLESLETKPVTTKRKATVSSDTMEDDQSSSIAGSLRKRRRLNQEETQESSFVKAQEVSPTRKASEQNDDADKKSIKAELGSPVPKKDKRLFTLEEKGTPETAIRRSSLRSAGHTGPEGTRKDRIAATDSDEETTLGDIREKNRTPRKISEKKEMRSKDEDQTKKRSSLSNEGAAITKTLLHQLEEDVDSAKRGRHPRRSISTLGKADAQSPRKISPEKKHTKKKESEDGSTEKKIFLMSAWRLVSSHRHAAIFAHPVSERDARGYSATVKKRMDLSALKKSVESGEVRDLAEFKRRLLLMFANAVMFNSTGHDVNIYAKEMATDTMNSLKDLEKDILYVRGGMHITRRSAAFAAEEVLERRRIVAASTPVKAVGSKEKADETFQTAGSRTGRSSADKKSIIKAK